jgi:hypothetical protein
LYFHAEAEKATSTAGEKRESNGGGTVSGGVNLRNGKDRRSVRRDAMMANGLPWKPVRFVYRIGHPHSPANVTGAIGEAGFDPLHRSFSETPLMTTNPTV